MHIRRYSLVMVMLMISTAASTYAKSPLESLEQPIQAVVDTLNDPQYKDPSRKADQKDILWTTMHEIFSFIDISRRALGRNWGKFSPDERKAFTDVFTDLLSNTYLDKIQRGEYQGLKIEFLGEEILKDTIAQVATKIINKDQEIPVSYSMILREKTWKIYDIKVEGVSLIRNYYVQFKKILEESSPAELIERLRKKVEAQDKENTIS
jgi:phospholipid transport system substrate-binding protein